MVISRVAFCVCCMLALLTSGLLHAQQNGTVTYVYTDPQGTPLAEADAQGNVIATYDYTPYGTTALGTPPKGPGYTGHVNDPETNLVYMQHRYYDPVTGHFLSVDPVTPVPGNAFNFNRYVYVNNNPTLNTDPNGEQCAQCLYSPGDSIEHQAEINQAASGIALGQAIGLAPIVGDVQNVADAVKNPTPFNVIVAAVGVVPEAGGAIAKVTKEAKAVGELAKGAAGGERAGKAFTRADKAAVKADNAAAHDGKVVCEACGRETVPSQQSKAGVTPPGNEAQVDHVVPRSKGGDGSPANAQVLCRDCNIQKSDKTQ
jgi:RHS repeat-associated protein